MSPVTYDLLAALSVLTVPAIAILCLVLRTQVKEIELLRKQVAYLKDAPRPLASPDADDPTSEHVALEFDGTQTDQLAEDVRDQGHLPAGAARKVGYEAKAISVFEKIKARR